MLNIYYTRALENETLRIRVAHSLRCVQSRVLTRKKECFGTWLSCRIGELAHRVCRGPGFSKACTSFQSFHDFIVELTLALSHRSCNILTSILSIVSVRTVQNSQDGPRHGFQSHRRFPGVLSTISETCLTVVINIWMNNSISSN